MAQCSYCGGETAPHDGAKAVCLACEREHAASRALAASELTKARVGMRAAVDDVSRLTDFYVAMPKPSSDGDLAVKLAKRTYELADAELKRALKAYKAAMEL